jgi:hypothetical protein
MAGPGNVSIAVVDTGTGLDTTKVDHIFDAFFTTKPGRYGNGPVDLPLDRRSAWRPPVGVAKFYGGSVFQFTVPAAANRPCEAGS